MRYAKYQRLDTDIPGGIGFAMVAHCVIHNTHFPRLMPECGRLGVNFILYNVHDVLCFDRYENKYLTTWRQNPRLIFFIYV